MYRNIKHKFDKLWDSPKRKLTENSSSNFALFLGIVQHKVSPFLFTSTNDVLMI